MLSVRNLTAGYGELKVLHDMRLNVAEGEIVSILGSNGAGKSTLLRVLSGLIPAKHGEIHFRGENITHWPDFRRVAHGLIQVPENRGIVGEFTILENLELGAYVWRKDRSKVQAKIQEMLRFFPRLEERKHHKGAALSGGEQQMLAIAKGMMSLPKLLILDEPSTGLSPIMTKEIFKLIRQLSEMKISILLVEQNAGQALKISDRAYVMNHGALVKEGDASSILTDADIQKIYLGA
jgi:branched-chain amino acid transport system ATP-binding protein